MSDLTKALNNYITLLKAHKGIYFERSLRMWLLIRDKHHTVLEHQPERK